MSQYKTGTVAVTNGSQNIVGTGTAWLANAAAGQVFSIDGSGVPYVIGSVTDDTHATLSTPYAGATASGQPYSITTSYTPTHSLPYPENGDVDTTTILKRAMLLIDSLFTAATAYADSLVVGLLDDRGNYDASGNTFPASGGSGAAGAIKKGDVWYISVAGTLGGLPVIVGDAVRALTDAPGQTAGNWSIMASASEDIAANIHAATANATPSDASEFGFWDSVAGALRKCSLTNLKAVLKAYFDPIYAAIAGSASQVFSVGTATAAAHAVRADQIQGASLTAFTTGGTGTAFTLTPTPAIAAYTANQTWDVIFNAACGAAPTFAVSGLASPPNLVRQLLDGSYQNLASGDFPSGWQSPVKLVSASQALVLKLPRRTKTGSFTRDLTAASGTVSITGVGFKPAVVRFYGSIGGAADQSNGEASAAGNIVQVFSTTTANNGATATSCIYFTPTVGDEQVATCAMTADGFDLTWTKAGTPTGTGTIVYMAEE